MPRKARFFLASAIYHVYSRVARGEYVFDEPGEADEFVRIVRDVRDLDGFRILAWCLMGNHYHLVIRTGEVALWRSMARIQGKVSRGYNRRHRFFGRLWQSRYKARIIDTNDYVRQVVAYVHLNPVSAGLVDDPTEFERSGHGALIGYRKAKLVDPSEALLGFADGSGQDTENYLSWIRAIAEARWLSDGLETLPWWVDARHVDEIAVPGRHPKARTFDGRDPPEFDNQLEFTEFARRYYLVSGFRLDDIRSSCRNPRLLEGRIELVTLAVGRNGYRCRDVASFLCKDPGSVTRWLRFGICQQREDSAFRERLISLERIINQGGSNEGNAEMDTMSQC